MEIKKVEVGDLKTNCYVLVKGLEALIIDPGADKEKIINLVGNKKVLAILITHYHFDHVGVLDEIKTFYSAPIIDYRSDKTEKIGPFIFEIIDTKGHKNDAVSYYFKSDEVMFVGDFIFKGTIGRCDLPGGNLNEMKLSLNKIKEYKGNITLYPGHGSKTILKDEILNNEHWW